MIYKPEETDMAKQVANDNKNNNKSGERKLGDQHKQSHMHTIKN